MKILFKIFPQRSHYNATFPLARALREGGFEVVYAGLAPLRRQVEAQGFSYFVQDEDAFVYVEHRVIGHKPTFWTPFLQWLRNRKALRTRLQRHLTTDAILPVVRAVRPDIVLVDSPYTLFAISLASAGVRFGMLESMVNLNQDDDCPPLDTSLVPTGGRISRLLIRLHWRRYFLKRVVLGWLGWRLEYQRKRVVALAQKAGMDPAQIDFNRYLHLGLRTLPEFLLSPRPLDFPRRLSRNQVYVGPSINLNREESMSDYVFPSRFDRFVAARKQGMPLLYCSLGTGAWRYAGAERFLFRLLDAARGARWNLILAVSTEFDPGRFSPPPNAAVFQVVPQIKVLREADLMITHGGMNSYTECASLGVPMLVYPGNSEIDQHGTAARVVYHGLGLKGCMARESTAGLRRKSDAILANSQYKTRAMEMAAQLRATGDPAAAFNRFLDGFSLPRPAPTPTRDRALSQTHPISNP